MFKIEYLSRYNLSFRVGVMCLHDIPSRLSPAPTFRTLKNMSAVMLYSYTELLDQLTLKIQNCNFHALLSKSRKIMNCTGIPSVCVSPM